VGDRSGRALCIVAATTAAACATIGSAPASGSTFEGFRKAVWRVTLTGTFHSEGQVTNYRCVSGEDANGFPIFYTASGAASETATLSTVRVTKLYVERDYGHKPRAVSPVENPFDLLAAAQIRRTSTLDGPDEPQGCSPSTPPRQPDCGTKTARHGLVVGDAFPRGLTLTLSPADKDRVSPFVDCPLVVGQDEIPAALDVGKTGIAAIPVARLFGRERRLVVTGGRNWTTHESAPGDESTPLKYDASATQTVSWTLTLVRLQSSKQICHSKPGLSCRVTCY
jgi:hypothetical protein